MNLHYNPWKIKFSSSSSSSYKKIEKKKSQKFKERTHYKRPDPNRIYFKSAKEHPKSICIIGARQSLNGNWRYSRRQNGEILILAVCRRVHFPIEVQNGCVQLQINAGLRARRFNRIQTFALLAVRMMGF